MQNHRTHNDTGELFKVILEAKKHLQMSMIEERQLTHHNLDELVILCRANFTDVVEEDWKLREVNCVRHFREDPLELYSEDLNKYACKNQEKIFKTFNKLDTFD